MKSLIAIICITAIAINSAISGVEGVVYCIDKEPGQFCGNSNSEPLSDSGSCFPFEKARKAATTPMPYDCSLCIDFEITGSDSEVPPRDLQVILKAAPVIVLISTEIIPVRGVTTVSKSQPTRAPPGQFRASRQYADTVQFRV